MARIYPVFSIARSPLKWIPARVESWRRRVCCSLPARGRIHRLNVRPNHLWEERHAEHGIDPRHAVAQIATP